MPARLLGIGLPAMLLLGFGAAAVILPGPGLIGAALVSVMLAPTDAALGETVVSDRRVPVAVRQGLDVESGLSDGLAVPFFLVLTELVVDPGTARVGLVLQHFAVQVGIGLLAGIAIGGLGGYLVKAATRTRLMQRAWGQIVVALLAVACYLVADLGGGSGFVAAFCGGIVYSVVYRATEEKYPALTGCAGTLLSGVSYLILGAVLVPLALDTATPMTWLYAAASLLVLRPLAVGVAMLGSKASRPTIAFAGWFGPRALATIVFALLLVEEPLVGSASIAAVAIAGVTMSVFAHGVTCRPLVGRYVRVVAAHRDALVDRIERAETDEVTGRLHAIQTAAPMNPSP